MSAAAPTTGNQPAAAAAAKRSPAIQALVTSSADSSPSGLSDAPQSPALTPRGGYYVSRTTGRVVSWAELKDAEREGDGNMTYFCAVM